MPAFHLLFCRITKIGSWQNVMLCGCWKKERWKEYKSIVNKRKLKSMIFLSYWFFLDSPPPPSPPPPPPPPLWNRDRKVWRLNTVQETVRANCNTVGWKQSTWCAYRKQQETRRSSNLSAAGSLQWEGGMRMREKQNRNPMLQSEARSTHAER